MKVPDNVAQIFAALLSAAGKGALSVMVGKDHATGEIRYFIGAIGNDDGALLFAPFGHLIVRTPLPDIPKPVPAKPGPTLH